MRDFLQVYINGHPHKVDGVDTWLTLSEYLRQQLRLKGTKIVCEEGDCGACSVLIANLHDRDPQYEVIDSCIAYMFQLDGHHIISIEGLGNSDKLTCVQQAMIDCHGSQCGFCTPGIVMAMTGVLERADTKTSIDARQWQSELSGNLCRCTGYQSILQACEQSCHQDRDSLAADYPISDLQADYSPLARDSIAIDDGNKHCFVPTTLTECIRLRTEHPRARLVAGATDVGVQCNKQHSPAGDVICLRRVNELQEISVSYDSITFGAAATWTDLLPVCKEHYPALGSVLEHFGSPQIRNMGTIGGNLANASPIADSLPLLHVLNAELELIGPKGSRWQNINGFYTGYKQFDLKADEVIARIRIPRVQACTRLRLYKVSRRLDLDISTFTAAISMKIQANRILSASIAYGGVGPMVLRLAATESFLVDKAFTADTMQAAGEIAVREITPISDVRGSAAYRNQLAKNILMKFFYEESQ